jgi:hypothetical protein
MTCTMALHFQPTDKSLIVSGKTFVVKDIIKVHGGIWDAQKQNWLIPIEKDGPEFRANLLDALSVAMKAKKEAKAAERPYIRPPETVGIAQANERATIKRLVSQGSVWLCCENCTVISWQRQLVTCDSCARDEGPYKNTFRVRGMTYTGD